jgi:hypothetical protein
LSLDSCIGNKGEKEMWRKVALHPWNLSQESMGSLCISFAFLAFGGVVCYTKPVRPVPKISQADFVQQTTPPKAKNAKEMHKLPLDSWDRF